MMDKPQYQSEIDTWVDEHADQMLEDLKALIRIPSVRGEAKEGMPYGEMPARVLAAMQDLMGRYGFRTTNYENYCVTADMDAAQAGQGGEDDGGAADAAQAAKGGTAGGDMDAAQAGQGTKAGEAGAVPVIGKKALDILAHLDVVPVSDTWTKTQPFEPLVEGHRIYGRGTIDDKGPAIAALYAMRCVRELGLPLKYGVRLICGSDEENGSDDLRHYYAWEKEAPYTFTPDADYPLINVEKGRLEKTFFADGSLADAEGADHLLSDAEDAVIPLSDAEDSDEPLFGAKTAGARIRSIYAGDTTNIAPGKGTLTLTGISEEMLRLAAQKTQEKTGGSFSWDRQGDEWIITAHGESAHAASPQAGVNSATMILTLVQHLPAANDAGVRLLHAVERLFPHGSFYGEGMDVFMSDEESGRLTMSLDILRYETSEKDRTFRISGTFDCRAPICCNDENLTAKVRGKLEEAGFQMETGGMIPPHYVSADSELVKKLLESYELYFGQKGEPVATGGGTYVHSLARGVAFGCAVPEVDNHMHGDDEFMDIPMLVKSAKIFADAIMRLCG